MDKKTAAILMVFFLILALMIFAWVGWQTFAATSAPGNLESTATYGAQQFSVQLTAMAAGK